MNSTFLTLKGAKQGQIKGGVIQKGKEGAIEVLAYHHDIISPRDPASGLPTGKRMHKPFVITKEIDQSTPKLYSALVNNENITEFTLRFYGPNRAGMQVEFYRVELVNANIASIEDDMLLTLTEPGKSLPILERISFTYQKITWTWVEGGITASDDWETPVA